MSPLALSQTEAQRKVGRCSPAHGMRGSNCAAAGVPLHRCTSAACAPHCCAIPSPLPPSCPGSLQVLDRRPSVPKLPLARLLSGDQGAHLPAVAVAADEAVAADAADAEAQQAQPAVPRLALSKLNPLAVGGGSGSGRGGSGSGRWRPTAQASRIPAANFSTMDATAQRSPSKLPSGAQVVGVQQAAQGGTGNADAQRSTPAAAWPPLAFYLLLPRLLILSTCRRPARRPAG